MRRIVSLLIALVMVFSVLPMQAAVYAANKVQVDILSTPLSLNFIEDEAQSVLYQIRNHTSDKQNLTAVYSVVSENNETVWTKSEPISISWSSTKSVEAKLNITEYGVHTLKIELKNDAGTVLSSATSRVSLSRKLREINESMGISAHFGWSEGMLKTMPLFKNLGAGYLRDEMQWHSYEKELNTYKLPDFWNKYVDQAIEAGIEPVIILDFGNVLYTADDNAFPATDAELRGWYNYVYNLAKAMSGRVKYFEVWNEPNLDNQVSGEEYAALLKKTREAINAAGTGAKLIGLVTAGTSHSFFNSIISADSNAAGYMDLASFHTYNDGLKPENKTAGNTTGYADLITSGTEKIRQYFGNKEVWLTETGYYEGQNNISESTAAEYSVRTMLLNDSLDACTKTFIYTWVNHINPWGLLDSKYNAKKNYVALSAMNSFIGGKTFDERTVDASGNNMYRYVKENETVTVLYNENDTAGTVNAAADYQYNTLYDMYGNELELAQNGNGYSIATGSAPVYLVSSAQAAEETADGAVMNYPENKAYVNGRITGAKSGEQFMIYVMNAGKTIADVFEDGALVFADQASVSDNGDYSFNFPMTSGEGVYNIYLGYGDSAPVGPVTLDVKRSLGISIGLFEGAEKIANMSEILADGEALKAIATIDNSCNVPVDASLYAAGFDANRMMWSKLLSDKFTTPGVHNISFDVERALVSGNDEIKIFLWSADGKPMTGADTIK